MQVSAPITSLTYSHSSQLVPRHGSISSPITSLGRRMFIEPVHVLEQTSLGEPLQARVVDVLDTEANIAAEEPLKVVKDGPCPGTRYVDLCGLDMCINGVRGITHLVHMDAEEDVVEVVLEVVCTTQIPERFVDGSPLALEWLAVIKY